MFLSGKSSVINGIVAKLHCRNPTKLAARASLSGFCRCHRSHLPPIALYCSFACFTAVLYARAQGNNETGLRPVTKTINCSTTPVHYNISACTALISFRVCLHHQRNHTTTRQLVRPVQHLRVPRKTRDSGDRAARFVLRRSVRRQ